MPDLIGDNYGFFEKKKQSKSHLSCPVAAPGCKKFGAATVLRCKKVLKF